MSGQRILQPYVMTDRRGMTLVELMVALTILSFAMVFVLGIFMTQHRSYVVQQDVADAQSDARASLDLLTRDLRSAGYGVQAGQTGITATTDGNPDSITFQAAQGASTFLTATPASSTINVNSTAGFTAGTQLNLLSVLDKSQLGPYAINTVAGPTQLILSATPPATVRQGDLVANTVNLIQYRLSNDPVNPGTSLLQRWLNGAPENLADHILDLQFQYTMSDGTVQNAVTGSYTFGQVRLVQVTITSQTVQTVSESNGLARTRQLSTVIRLRNDLS